jgi:hypothetical protein
LPNSFIDDQLDCLESLLLFCIVAIADAEKFVSVLCQEFFGPSLTGFQFQTSFHGVLLRVISGGPSIYEFILLRKINTPDISLAH